MRVREPSVKLKSAILEVLYLAWLGLFLVRAFAWTTMFEIKWTEEFMWWVTATGFAIAFLRAAVGSFEDVTVRPAQTGKRKFFDDYGMWMTWQILLAVLLALFMIRNYHRFETDRFMLMTLAAILGAKGIDFRKIAAVFFAVTAVFLLITMWAAKTDRIENLIYTDNSIHGYKARIAYGIVYPTDFAAHVFFIGTTWVWLRGKKITYAEIAVIFAAGWFVYAKCDAWLTTGVLAILGLGLIYLKIRERKSSRAGRKGRTAEAPAPYCMNRIVSGIMAWMAPIAATVILILAAIYTTGHSGIAPLDRLLHHRIMHAKHGFKLYPLKWFGQVVHMNGLGGRTEKPKEYFFIDSSYPNILLRYGIGIFALVIIIWMIISLRERRNKEWQRLLVLSLIAADCFMEHHLMEIAYHPYLLLLFAQSTPKNRKISAEPGEQTGPEEKSKKLLGT